MSERTAQQKNAMPHVSRALWTNRGLGCRASFGLRTVCGLGSGGWGPQIEGGGTSGGGYARAHTHTHTHTPEIEGGGAYGTDGAVRISAGPLIDVYPETTLSFRV
jgi:hypothetical protein